MEGVLLPFGDDERLRVVWVLTNDRDNVFVLVKLKREVPLWTEDEVIAQAVVCEVEVRDGRAASVSVTHFLSLEGGERSLELSGEISVSVR